MIFKLKGVDLVTKSVLVVVHTHFQLLTAIQLKMTVYEKDTVDIILCDHVMGFKAVYFELGISTLFSSIHYIDGARYDKILRKLLLLFTRLDPVLKPFSRNYDEFVYFNFTALNVALKRRVKAMNSACNAQLMAEGILSNIQYDLPLNFNSKAKRLMYKMLGESEARITEESYMYLYRHDLIDYERIPIKPLRIPDVDLSRFAGYLTSIYRDCRVIISERFIFFEQPHNQDGYSCDDETLINITADLIGRDDIMIKLHPRSVNNRFPGLRTLPASKTPWEAFVLNQNMNDKVFITIDSASAINARLLYKCKARVILLYKVLGISNRKYSPVILDKFVVNIREAAGGQEWIYVPKDIEEYKIVLKRINDAETLSHL